MDYYLSTAYLAPVQYYTKILAGDSIFIEKCENYVKQSYRSRCNIVSANGVIPLSIPVEHNSGVKVRSKDIRIADHGNWQHIHWNAIISAYNSTPFFEYYQDDFAPFYQKKFEFLFDFNEELRRMICGLIGLDESGIRYTDEYKMDFSEKEADFRDLIHPKKDWVETDKKFVAKRYYQVFDQRFSFVPNMSIIDLLFNMGNESVLVLSDSIV